MSYNRERIKGFIIYFSVAGFAYLVNVVSRILINDWLNRLFGEEYSSTSFSLSVIVAYLIGMLVAFNLTKRFVFGAQNSGKTKREAVKFFAVSVVALSITLLFAIIGLEVNNAYLKSNPEFHSYVKETIGAFGFKFINRELLSHIFGTFFGFFTNYFGHKHFTFKKTGLLDWVRSQGKKKDID